MVDFAVKSSAIFGQIAAGGTAMVAIVPNLVDAELTTLAIMLWVALCVFVSLLDRTPRSYMFVLSGALGPAAVPAASTDPMIEAQRT
jgi:uncharacterized membrane protein YccC